MMEFQLKLLFSCVLGLMHVKNLKYLEESFRTVYSFPIRNGLKQGDVLSPLLFNFVLEYAIRRVQVNQDGLKLNGTHQLLVYADDVNTCILGGSVLTVEENAEALVLATKETGLEVNTGKTKCMIMSRDRMQDEVTV